MGTNVLEKCKNIEISSRIVNEIMILEMIYRNRTKRHVWAKWGFHLSQMYNKGVCQTQQVDKGFHLSQMYNKGVRQTQQVDKGFHLYQMYNKGVRQTQQVDKSFHLYLSTCCVCHTPLLYIW
jgi:hypothetical protein